MVLFSGVDINTYTNFQKTLPRVGPRSRNHSFENMQRLVANYYEWLLIETSGCEDHSQQGFLKVGIY